MEPLQLCYYYLFNAVTKHPGELTQRCAKNCAEKMRESLFHVIKGICLITKSCSRQGLIPHFLSGVLKKQQIQELTVDLVALKSIPCCCGENRSGI